MQFILSYALSFLGTPYFYGGDDPIKGIDCSGLVMELLIAAGVFSHGTDMTAQSLYNHFENNSGSGWALGSLAFYGKDARNISHVAFCLNEKLMIESGGGTSTTKTLEEAIQRNAFVRIRPIKYRKDFFCVLKPDYML
jgi:cell wall-associated NlpC family hydrolase